MLIDGDDGNGDDDDNNDDDDDDCDVLGEEGLVRGAPLRFDHNVYDGYDLW